MQKPNTGPNEANSRFLSDCYSRKSLENMGKYEISGMVPDVIVSESRQPNGVTDSFQDKIRF